MSFLKYTPEVPHNGHEYDFMENISETEYTKMFDFLVGYDILLQAIFYFVNVTKSSADFCVFVFTPYNINRLQNVEEMQIHTPISYKDNNITLEFRGIYEFLFFIRYVSRTVKGKHNFMTYLYNKFPRYVVNRKIFEQYCDVNNDNEQMKEMTLNIISDNTVCLTSFVCFKCNLFKKTSKGHTAITIVHDLTHKGRSFDVVEYFRIRFNLPAPDQSAESGKRKEPTETRDDADEEQGPSKKSRS
jgi:hypothetical protein